MNNLQVFKNPEFGEIRSVIINDEPMFCLTDVCKALELTQPSKVKDRLSQKGVNTIPTLTAGGMQNLLYISEPDPEPSPKEETKEELPESGGDPIIEDIPVEPSVAPQVVIEPVITREVVQAQGTPQKVPEPIETQEAEEVKLDPTQNIRIAAEGVELIYEYTDEGVIVRVKKSSESPPEAANEADEAPIPTRLSEAPTEVPRDSVNWVEVTTMIFMGGLLLLELVDKIKLLKKPKK